MGRGGPRHRTLFKALLFQPLARLPVTVAAHLLPPALHEPFTRFLVQAGDLNRGGAFLAATMLRGESAPAGQGRPVLIGGPARVGKSRAARLLADRLGYPVLNTDHLHGWYGVLGGHAEVGAFRDGWVSHLLGKSGKGVILEGALLVMEGRHDTGDARVCLDAFERWCGEHGAVGLTVGCAESDRIERLHALEEHLATCWTARHGRRKRWDVVRHVAHLSTALQREAAQRGVPYREISPRSFDADIGALVAEAEAEVRGEAKRGLARDRDAEGLDRAAASNAPGEDR